LPLRFPKSVRLRRAVEFRAVREAETTWFGRFMVLNVLRQEDSSRTRVGIVTSRRLGSAVVRNRVRRRLREIIRATLPELIPGVWLVLVAKEAAAGTSYGELKREWLRLAQRASILPARR
jgi:ribonuclease P protein component